MWWQMLMIAFGRLGQQDSYSSLIWATDTFQNKEKLLTEFGGETPPSPKERGVETGLRIHWETAEFLFEGKRYSL